MRRRKKRHAFTLIELMVVVVIIAVLIALLFPVIAGAIRTSRNAAVQAEFNVLGAALEAFKTRHGEYPPSRIMLCEDGYWNTTDPTPIPVPGGGSDVTYGALAQRSATAIRRFWPRVPIQTSFPLFDGSATWYDFDGDGEFDPPATPGRGVVLSGDECLVFFLGGLPLQVGTSADPEYTTVGFARGSTTYPVPPSPPAPAGTRSPGLQPQPFRNGLRNLLASNTAYHEDREKVGYEFKPGRLKDEDGDGFPSYVDSLGTGKPIAYFVGWAGGYDPNDVNYPEPGADGTPATVYRKFKVAFAVTPNQAFANGTREAVSPAPNPFSSSLANAPTVAWQRQATFQLISAGGDGLYGLGGAYKENGPIKLPPESGATLTNDPSDRVRTPDHDDLTNFAAGPLE